MGTSLQSPALVFAADTAIIAMRGELAKVKLFATNFSAEAVEPGTTMKVPVFLAGAAKQFDENDSNYETANGSVVYVPVTFDHHMHSTFEFADKDFTLVNGTAFWENAGKASGDALAEGIVEAVCGVINSTNIPKTGLDPNYTQVGETGKTASGCEIPAFSAANEAVIGGYATSKALKTKIAGLRKNLKAVGAKAKNSVLALSTDIFADLLDSLDANIFGGASAIADGIVPNLYGFKAVIECDDFGTGSALGAVIPEDAIAVAGRAVPVVSPESYTEVGTTIDDASGLVITTRRHGNPAKGKNFATMEALFGAKLVQPTKVIRLVNEATA